MSEECSVEIWVVIADIVCVWWLSLLVVAAE